MRGRQLLAVLLAVVVIAGISACSSSAATPPRGLTDAQAQQLSLARFSTYRLGTVTLNAAFTTGGTAVELTGWVDYPAEVAYAESTQDGKPGNLLMWNRQNIALARVDSSVTSPPLPQPTLDTSWGTAQIDTSQSELQQILVVIISLGADRPDNALLVAQNGARFLRTEKVGDESMNVYAVPPNATGASTTGAATATGDTRAITYWIDGSGAIHRAAFALTSGTDVTISLGTGGGPSLRDPFTAPAAITSGP